MKRFRKFISSILITFSALSWNVLLNSQAVETPTQLFHAGQNEQAAENYFKAIEYYRSALEIAPNYRDPIIGLSESYFALEEYEETLDWLKKAQKYDRKNLRLLNLEGRTLVAIGKWEEAYQRFSEVLSIEPHNVSANFGLAELNIVQGKTDYAATRYQDALRYSPGNKQALLSLMLVHDARGDQRKAEEYIREALNRYSHDPQVHYYAAKHYFQFNLLDEAELQANIAVSLREDFIDALLLLSTIHLERENYRKVIPLLTEVISKNRENRENNILWYLLGLANAETGNIEQSVNSFSRAFRMRTDDEISRIFSEYVIIDRYDFDDPIREQFASYHFEKGKLYEEKNYFQKALDEYRRGLKIDPFSEKGRLLYARLLNKLGHPARYLSQLEILIEDIEYKTTDIMDEYEIQQSIQEDSVANRWSIQQFPSSLKKIESGAEEKRSIPLERFQYNCILFYRRTNSTAMEHFGSEKILARYFNDILTHQENINSMNDPLQYEGFAAAYNQARTKDAHYFLSISFRENARSFYGECEIYNAETGDHITTFTAYRTGNNKVAETLLSLSSKFINSLPVRGRLVDRRFDTGLINLGKSDGIETEESLLIVKNGAVQIARDSIGLEYEKEELLGTITVDEVDELIAEGAIETDSFFDLINPGDEVLRMQPQENQDEELEGNDEGPSLVPPLSRLYQEIIQIR